MQTLLTFLPIRHLLLVFAIASLLCGAEAQTNVPIPAPNEILRTLHREHPRLFASRAEFAALKERISKDPLLQQWQKKLTADAEKIISQPVSKYEIPDGLRLLATSRRVLNRVQELGLLYQLDGDKRWVERAWHELEAAAQFPDWNPRHFLDTAEMTHAFALGYDWFYDAWTPQQRETLRTAVVEKGLKPAAGVYRGTPGKSSRWNLARHNWNQVCNGGITVGALGVANEEPALAAELLSAACKSVQLAMTEFAPDGAWKEGPGYWNYATTYNCAMLACLDSALGTDFGLSKIPAFSECGTFPMYETGPIGKTFNYADGGDGAIRAPHLFWLAKKFNRPEYASYEAKIASPAALDLLWYDATLVKPTVAQLDKYFRDAEVVTLRSEWNNPDALFIGFKGGDNKANHANLDLGTFVLDALGVRWFVDLGADDYNLPGYFGKQRWSYYRMRAEGHNILVLNPSENPDQDLRAKSQIVRYQSDKQRAFAIADLTEAYARDARAVKRGIAMIDRKRVLVQDELQCDKPGSLWWFAHTPAKIDVSKDGSIATLTLNGKKLTARILAPSQAKFETLKAAPLPGSAKPEKQNGNRGIQKLAIHIASGAATTVAVVFDTNPANGTASEVIPLARW